MNPRFKTITALNVRSGPGLGYTWLKILAPGTIVEEVMISSWCPVAQGQGQIGWVFRKFLIPFEEPPEVPGQVTGEMLLGVAEAMIGEQRYVLGADSPLKQGDAYIGSTDCAEFATERIQEVTGKIYGALRPESSNPDPWTGQWLAEIQAGILISIPVEMAIRTPGALLLRFDKQVQHIAFSTGDGHTVEAKGKNYGVVKDVARGRGFQYGILIPGVVYKTLD